MIPEIVPAKEHYEVYLNGTFYCSADNKREAEEEIKNYYKGSDSQ